MTTPATSPDGAAATARSMYLPCELLHVVGYFAPETTQAYRDAGLRSYMMGYFASRSAPMGAVPPEVTAATFYVFAPRLVRKSLPEAWAILPPERVVELRLAGIDAILRRVLAPALHLDGPEVREAAELGRAAVDGLDIAGRALCAGHARLPWPEEPHLALWHAVTVLREHRGDGHVAALLTAELDPVEALVNYASVGAPRDFLKSTRGWSEQEWTAAEERLRERGLLAADGQATDAGRALRREVEMRTDTGAAAPYRRLGPQRSARLLEALRPVADAIAASDVYPPGLFRSPRKRA